jgi:hypothetical protein
MNIELFDGPSRAMHHGLMEGDDGQMDERWVSGVSARLSTLQINVNNYSCPLRREQPVEEATPIFTNQAVPMLVD